MPVREQEVAVHLHLVIYLLIPALLPTCSYPDATGSTVITNYNDGNYTKISISGSSQASITGFNVTFAIYRLHAQR